MVERVVVSLTVLVLYILLGMAVAFYSRRYLKRGEADFYIAAGRLGGIVAALTYSATTYSAFMMVGLVGLAYATGVGALGFELAYYVATLLLLVYFARRVWRRARERGWVSPAEMLSDHYGSRLIGALIAFIYLIALIPYAAIQVKGVGELIAGLGGGSWEYYIAGVVLATVLIGAWSLIAGIWSVALTDAFQGLFMLLAGLLYTVWIALVVFSSGGSSSVTIILGEKGLLGLGGFWSFQVFLAYTIPWVFFAAVHPQVVQRIYMPRDERSLALMVRGFAIFGLLYTIIAVTVGLLARAGAEQGVLPFIDTARRDAVTPTLLAFMNPLLAAVIFTSIVAAAVTTADSIILSLASSASRDLAYKLSPERRLYAGYAAIIVFTLAAALVAYTRKGFIVDLAVLSSLMLLALAPATLACWLNVKAPWWSALLSIALGFLATLLTLAYYERPALAFLSTVRAPWGLEVPVSVIVLALSTLPLVVGLVLARKR